MHLCANDISNPAVIARDKNGIFTAASDPRSLDGGADAF